MCLIFKKIPIPAEKSCKSFFTSYTMTKNEVLIYILTIKHQMSSRSTTSPPPFRSVLLLFQITRGWEESQRPVVRSPAGGQRALNWVHSLALSKWTDDTAPV
jgi:hypothetical protein